jgi:hypothetical protein
MTTTMKPILAAAIALLLAALAPPKPAASKPDARQPAPLRKFLRFGWPKIARETTYLTEPLAPDGLVDYPAALNRLQSEGVTNDNNAAVLLLRAMRPRSNDKGEYQTACRNFGIDPIPAERETLLSSDAFRQQIAARFARDPAATAASLKTTPDLLRRQLEDEDLWDQIERDSAERPWNAANEPILAGWLERNAGPMKMLTQAARRPKFYLPFATGEDPDGNHLSEWPCDVFSFWNAFHKRAMRRFSDDEPAQAWDDLITEHRLGAHIARRGMLIDWAIGTTAIRGALPAIALAANHPGFAAKDLEKLETEFADLPPGPRLAEIYSNGERCFALQLYNEHVRTGATLSWLVGMIRDSDWFALETPNPSQPQRFATALLLDWSAIYRAHNARVDNRRIALQLPARKRKAAFEQAATRRAERKSVQRRVYRWFSIAALDPVRMRTALSLEFASLLADDGEIASRFAEIDEEVVAKRAMTTVSLALARFRADRHLYPAKLDELVPKYLAKLPLDTFNDELFRYRREKVGFALYSVGPNGQDEQGRNDDGNSVTLQTARPKGHADDIVYHIPWQPPK